MYSRKAASRVAIALFPLLAACVGSAEGGTDPTPAPAPTAPVDPAAAPQVLMATPTNGAKGVLADAVIELRFSKAMSRNTVEAAYTSMSLPKEAVTFAWNETSETLRITPTKGFPYAEGAPDVAALPFEIRIAKAATDSTGRPMAEDFVLGFASARRITYHAPTVANLTGRVLATGVGSAGNVTAGDVTLLGAEPPVRGFVTFDLTAVPDAIEAATLTLDEMSMSGNPDGDLNGLNLQQLSFSALDMSAYMTKATVGSTITRVLDANGPVRRADVKSMLESDLSNRVARQNRSQMRLSYALDSDKDGQADQLVLDGKADLSVVYVTP